MYYIEILLKLFDWSWYLLACVKLQIIHCSLFMYYCISIYECRFWSPSHVPLSPPAPLCLPWIWKQACRPFPLSHYHIQRGEIGGVGGQRKLRIGSKGKATPSLCHPAFFIGLPFYISLPDGGRMFSVSLFDCPRSQGCQLTKSKRRMEFLLCIEEEE